MTSSVARLLLALALLLGWQLSLVHPLKHVDSQGSYVHLGNHVPDRQSDSPDDLCDVIAGLTACIWRSAACLRARLLRRSFAFAA